MSSAMNISNSMHQKDSIIYKTKTMDTMDTRVH